MAYSSNTGGPGGSGQGRRRIRRGHVAPYPLPVRPLAAAAVAAPVVDLRATLHAVPPGGGTAGAWEHAVDYMRNTIAGDAGTAVATETIKSFDRRRGADQAQLESTVAALDAGQPVAFYGWWPIGPAATTSEILGVDAMEVPPPDRKGNALVDGHAVVLVGYGRHAAFPGGGYFIIRNQWRADGWGDDGDGYMPFTYLRAYATELCTARPAGRGPRDDEAATTPSAAARLPAFAPRSAEDVAADAAIDRAARCADPRSSLTHLFFSDDVIELARARAICSSCVVRQACLRRALERQEPYGVWGGEMVLDGRIVADKRGRGRPPKVTRPRLVVDEVTGIPIVA